ncbi:MAG: DUF1552 domain-containing protein [Nannocystaceae bacterium]
MTNRVPSSKLRRRVVLKGLGGLCLGLPVLEGLRRSGTASANEPVVEPFAIFLRQANGVAAQAQGEPERFWPRTTGTITPESLAGRALEELVDHRSRLLALGVDGADFDYGDGHARGAFQGLTARRAAVAGAGGDSEANGESLDHRIGRELNRDGRDSLFMYAGFDGGLFGGPCISYRGPGNRRAPLHNPLNAYQTIMGVDGETLSEQLLQRNRSVNDLVRGQMADLLASPTLSGQDVERLEQHRAAIRDLENSLACNFSADEEATLQGDSAGYDSIDGDLVLQAVRAHLDVAVLAVACGYTRSVAIQVGSGNDGTTRYRDPQSGSMMENFHFISHRRLSHGDDGTLIPDADRLHHEVDRQFARTFKYLLDRLQAYPTPTGSLLDAGVSVWYNDLGQGPNHTVSRLPYILAGSAGGYFRQGLHGYATGFGTHCRLLNMIGTAVGLRSTSGGDLDDFGDPTLPKHPIDDLLA